MKVGVIGAGSIGHATAALLMQNGHEVRLWSPSGARTGALENNAGLQATGKVTGSFFPSVARNAEDAVAGMDVLFIAAPAYAHRTLFDSIAPHITAGQVVIISAHYSFGALYLAQLLAGRDVVTPIVAWGTTVVTGRSVTLGQVNISTIRAQIDMVTVPARFSDAGLAACVALFGQRFVQREGGLLAITLSNVNPQNHMALALTNLTRMELGEEWAQFPHYTPAVGALVEALDAERLAIAAACDCQVRTVQEHLHYSYHVPQDTVSDMLQVIYAKGGGGLGPRTLDTRYVTEDCPFGLAVTALLGRKLGLPATLHESGVALLSALYSRDLVAENDLIAPLELQDASIDQLRIWAETGRPA